MSKRRIFNVNLIIYIVLFAASVIPFVPVYWALAGAFKTAGEVRAIPPTFFPKAPTFDNFITIFTNYPFSTFFFNSLWLGLVRTAFIAFSSSLIGYVLSKFRFRFRTFILMLFLSSIIVPPQVLLVPQFLLVHKLGFLNTYWALLIPNLISPFGVFLYVQYMHSIPNSLMDAGRIDGCSEFSIFLRIILPLCKPALAAHAIFKMMWEWESFLWPLVAVNKQKLFTLPVGLALFSAAYWTRTELVLAGSAIQIIPLLIVFLLLQKKFIEGVTLTGLKS